MSAVAVRRLVVAAQFVMVYGGGLKEPILPAPDDRDEVLDLLFLYGRAADGTSIAQLDGRPYLNVAMFREKPHAPRSRAIQSGAGW